MADTGTEATALGDCLLHLTHHGMTQECWSVVIDHYMKVADLHVDAVNSYKTTYERALLDAIRNEASMPDSTYDSTADTLKHSLRVGALMGQAINELVDRSVRHDLSKTEPPELEIFNEFTPKLKHSTYGSDEYKGFLEAMGEALQHHYRHNRHHPEWFGDKGVNGMTLVDLIEMIADWKAATERHDDGDLAKSLKIQQKRFGISDQLLNVLRNTAEHFGWIPQDAALAEQQSKAGLVEAVEDDWEPEVEEAPTAASASVVDLAKPYLGWLNHYEAGWQAAIVRRIDGQRYAYRLGEPLAYERATDMCRVLSEVTGVPVAGELSRRDVFLPVAMGGAR